MAVAAAAALWPVSLVRAQTDNWIGGDGNWSNVADWSPANVPGNGDTVNIAETDGVNRTINYDYSEPEITINSLTVDLTNAVGTASSILSMSANNLSAKVEYVGDSGSGSDGVGTIDQSGGENDILASSLA
jgi:hypothetical protein